jgi:RecA/RadA recombinase
MKTKKAEKMLKKRKKKRKLRAGDFLSTGSTMLNLACTGHPERGFIKGHYYFLVGDSKSGKTFLSLTCLAEAARNPNFDGYRFIYDNAEEGAIMDVKRFFGSKVYKRLQPPSFAFAQSGPEAPIYSETVEDFYYYLDDYIKKGEPFIYILDSMDSLSSRAERDKFDKTKKATRGQKEDIAGSYGDGKAKVNSANLRQFIRPLKKSKSILIIINQTRDNLGFGFEKKTRSGGRALRFYATIEMWSSVKKKIKRTARGKQRAIGVQCKIDIKKNRIIGREPSILMPIYNTYGIDDLGSCVDFLVEEGHWKKKKSNIIAPEFNLKAPRGRIIAEVEMEGAEKELRDLVWGVWKDIEEALTVKRKKRYE